MKGISELVATIYMIAITVSIAFLTYLYFSNNPTRPNECEYFCVMKDMEYGSWLSRNCECRIEECENFTYKEKQYEMCLYSTKTFIIEER